MLGDNLTHISRYPKDGDGGPYVRVPLALSPHPPSDYDDHMIDVIDTGPLSLGSRSRSDKS